MIYQVWIGLNKVPVRTHVRIYLSYHYTLAHIKDITLGVCSPERSVLLVDQFDPPRRSGSFLLTVVVRPTNGLPLCIGWPTFITANKSNIYFYKSFIEIRSSIYDGKWLEEEI